LGFVDERLNVIEIDVEIDVALRRFGIWVDECHGLVLLIFSKAHTGAQRSPAAVSTSTIWWS
jgi:hypothetical protein